MFRKLKLKTPTLVLVLLLGSISAFCQSPVFSGLQTQVNNLTTSTDFATVVSVDTKVTEAAAANLITPEEFETLDASIRTIYRTSTAFSVLGYGSMPNNTDHSVRSSSCVIKWHNTNPCQGAIKITSGATVVFITADDNISQRIYRDGDAVWGQALITVEAGSTLIIKGSPNHPLVIDGGAVLYGTYTNGGELSQLSMTTNKSGILITVKDTGSKFMASNATFQNNYCNDPGSGIIFNGETTGANFKTSSFFQSSFYNIWTKSTWTGPSVGTAIYSANSTYQEVTLADGSKNHGILMNHCHFMGNINDNSPRTGENAKLQNGGSCFAVQGGTLNLCIKNSLLESNYSSWHGGAIFWNITDGTLDLEGTTFTKNYAGLGGAVYVQGNLNLNNCTFTDNHAVIQNKNNPDYVHPAYVQGNGYDGCGGALYIQPSNAGGQAANCNLDLNNCIFDGNSADLDGGAILLYMVQNTNATTIHDVNVGITIDGTTENMLVKNNTAGRVGGALALTVANELWNNLNTFNLNTDIQLKGGKLCNNSVTEIYDNDRATFQGKGYGGGLFLHYAPVTIDSGFEIVENTSAKDGGALYVANGNVTAIGMQAYGNKTTAGNGGAICVNGGNFTMNNGTLGTEAKPNVASDNGGGVYVTGGDVTITGGTIQNNIATTGNGGGFYSAGGTVNISNAEISGNHANSGFGGGLFSAAAVTVSHTTVSGNNASKGGGFYVNPDDDSAITTVENGSSISGNTATTDGAGAYIASGDLRLNNSDITDNIANGNGGGFYVNGGNLTLEGGNIGTSGHPNKATNGGGFYMQGGESTISGGTVQYNEATNGGGLYMQGTDAENKATANFTNGYFQYNSANEAGGGIFLSSNSQLTMSGASRIISNTVSESNGTGGGIQVDGGEFIVVGGTTASLQVTNNTANGKANNVYLNGENDYITIDDGNSGTLGSMEVGVSINGRYLPKKVVYCVNEAVLVELEKMLKGEISGNSLVDDARRYEPKISSERPFEPNFLYFEIVWPVGITDDMLREFLNNGQVIKTIDTPEKLTMFMMLVNGYLLDEEGHELYYPGLEGVVTADLEMEGALWIPIGATKEGVDHPFTGSFDGGGHTISNLVSAGLTHYDDYGLFGKTQGTDIKNVIISDCNFVSGQSKRMGALICEMRGGTVENCIASGRVIASGSETNKPASGTHYDPLYCVVGGLIGEASNDGDNYPQIINSMSTVEVEALPKPDLVMYPNSQKITAGGLVGMTSAGTVVRNCYAHTSIQHRCERRNGTEGSDYDDDTPLERYVGGLVAINGGELTNCYVRFQDGMNLDMGEGSTNSSMFGMFAGNNTGSISYCYAPDEHLFSVSRTYINNGTPASNYGEYNNVTCPYTYASYLIDNQAKMSNETPYGTTESTTLLAKLNRWVEDNNPPTGDDIYSNWMRTKSSPINGDYPIPMYDNPTAPDYAVAGSKDGIMLEYGTSFNDILGRFNDYREGTLFIYEKLMKPADTRDAAAMVSDVIRVSNHENVKIYIDEDIPVLQSEGNVLKNVYTCQELKRTGLEDYWHNIATSLSGDKIGFIYGETGEVEWTEETNPCNVTLEDDGENTIFPTDAEISSIDLYCFYEPYYHWLNLKRNHLSHWHMNNHDANIPYNEGDNNQKSGDTLVPGKGYLAAIGKDMLLQGNGTLNNGKITIPVTVEAGTYNQGFPYENDGTELRGYNLLGNPYQSYLSFAKFIEGENAKLWQSEEGNATPTYWMYDPESDCYVYGIAADEEPSRGSEAATGYISMHQGFFIKALTAGPAVFTPAMRTDDPAEGTEFRRERPAYPLVNLYLESAAGGHDIAVVEFGRKEFAGAPKCKSVGSEGKLYFSYRNEDYAVLYLDEPTDQLPVHFDCQDGGTYTLSWSTANADFSYLHLIDNMTGMDIDMLTSDGYTFTANADDYKSRFKMVFAYTGIEENEDADTDAEHAEAFAFFSNGDLIVSGKGNLEVIDMTGHVLYSTRLTDTQSRVSMPQVAAGIYIVRLGEKVQKIVVR